MRSFPRAARRRLVIAAVAVSLAIGATAVPFAQADVRATVQAGDELKDRQKKVRKQIDVAHDHFEHSSRQLVRAVEALESARSELGAARDTLAGTRAKLAAAQVRDVEMQERLGLARADLDFAELAAIAGGAAVDRQRDSVAALVSDIYTEGDPELLAFAALMDARTPADLTLQEAARDAIVGRETVAYDELTAAEVLLEVQEGQVRDAKQEVAATARAAAEHVALMAQLETRAQEDKDEVVRLVGERTSASAQAKAAKQKDRKKLRQLKREDARIKKKLAEIARRARLRALRRGQPTAPTDSGGFLARPVPGPVTSPFGMRVHPIYGHYAMHDGTDFAGGCGTPMYAAADGRVVSSYASSSYGNRLLIDHGFQRGVGLATIYNHATSYTVGVGAQVTRGQVIGYVGSTGWSTGCHLHFTVTANGQEVDPFGWL